MSTPHDENVDERLATTAEELGGDWTPDAISAALDDLKHQGIDLDPKVEQPATLVAVIHAANLSPAAREPARDRLVLDQDAIDAMQPVPVNVEPSDLRGVDEIAKELAQGPVTLNGPEVHWCIQALANGSKGYVHIEILDPVHWENGPALPETHLQVAHQLGFHSDEGMWVLQVPAEDEADLVTAAEVIVAFMDRAWK